MNLRSGNVYYNRLARRDKETAATKKVTKRRQAKRRQDKRRQRANRLQSERASIQRAEAKTATVSIRPLANKATKGISRWRMRPAEARPAPINATYPQIELTGNLPERLAQLRSKSLEMNIGDGFWFNTGIDFPGMGHVSHYAFLEKVGNGKFKHYDNNGEPVGAGWTGVQRPEYKVALERALGTVNSGDYEASRRYIKNERDQGGKLSLGRFSRDYIHPLGGGEDLLGEISVDCVNFGAFCTARNLHPRVGLATFKDAVFDQWHGTEGDKETKADSVRGFIADQRFPRSRRERK